MLTFTTSVCFFPIFGNCTDVAAKRAKHHKYRIENSGYVDNHNREINDIVTVFNDKADKMTQQEKKENPSVLNPAKV